MKLKNILNEVKKVVLKNGTISVGIKRKETKNESHVLIYMNIVSDSGSEKLTLNMTDDNWGHGNMYITDDTGSDNGKKISFDTLELYKDGKETGNKDLFVSAKENNKNVFLAFLDNSDMYYPTAHCTINGKDIPIEK